MADLSNVPPEVMQILAHDPPYSPGELEILRAYAARPDANPVLVRAFQNPSLGIMTPQSAAPPPSDFGIPGLDIPDNIMGIGLPTRDFMSPPPTLADSSSAFHQDLRHQGAADINMDTAAPASPPPTDQVTPTTQAGAVTGGGFGNPLDLLSEDAFRGYGEAMKGFNPLGFMEPKYPNGGGTSASSGDMPERRDTPSNNPFDVFLGDAPPTTRQSGIAGPVSPPTTNLGDPRLSTRGAPGGQTTGADWRGLRELEKTLVPPDSAFANIPASEIGKLSTVMANPQLLAGMLYPDTPMTAAMATPNVTALAQLARYGLLSPGTKMLDEGQMGSGINQARLVEQTLNSMKGVNGAEVSPRAVYQEAFRRLLNTPVEEMSTGNGDPGDLSNQIAVTNAYLLLAKPFVSQGQQDFFEQKLNRWAEAYAQQYVNGETDVSYPQWLSDHGAQNLLGG